MEVRIHPECLSELVQLLWLPPATPSDRRVLRPLLWASKDLGVMVLDLEDVDASPRLTQRTVITNDNPYGLFVTTRDAGSVLLLLGCWRIPSALGINETIALQRARQRWNSQDTSG